MKYIPTMLDGFGGLAWHIVLIVSVIGLTGCAGTLIRTEAERCTIETADATAEKIRNNSECEKKERIEVVDAARPNGGYSLQFVEIDEQGFFRNRAQADRAINFAAKKPKDGTERIYYVVYVHGWFHGPEMSDDHLPGFLKALESLSRWRPSGEVRGIYIGWQGNPLNLPLLKYLTFWDRKNVSEEIGRGSLQEFLLRLEKVAHKNGEQNKLVTIGHSFGASVVFNALSHTLVQRFVDALPYEGGEPLPTDNKHIANPKGYGDLVVLINPAFEAMRFLPIHSMVQHFTIPREDESRPRIYEFANPGRPYFVVLSSEGDWATKAAFPAGRIFSTAWESHPPIFVDGLGSEKLSGWNLDRDTIGNFGKFASFEKLERASGIAATWNSTTPCPKLKKEFWEKLGESRKKERSSSDAFLGTDFILKESDGRGDSPFLLTSVDKSIIGDHSDIGKEDLACWIVQLADD